MSRLLRGKETRLNTIIQEVNALLNTVNTNHLGEA
jgi:hypothetical protein